MDKTITLKDMKKIELEILKYIKDVCSENNLNYYLCGGTLLGAIRHNGFIPWDDDIDIFLPREDYMKLLSILRENPHYKYKMMSFYDNEDYYYTYAKIVNRETCMIEKGLPAINGLGVYVDVFPLDGLPNGQAKRKHHCKKILFYRRMLYRSYSKSPKCSGVLKSLLNCPFWLISRLVGYKKLIKLVDSTAMKYKTNDSEFIACSVAGYGFKEIIPAKVINKTITVNFENEKFQAPAGYNVYLKSLYGDYMELPPKEKRISRHSYKAYWKKGRVSA